MKKNCCCKTYGWGRQCIEIMIIKYKLTFIRNELKNIPSGQWPLSNVHRFCLGNKLLSKFQKFVHNLKKKSDKNRSYTHKYLNISYMAFTLLTIS